jgi:pimeloyl-ACP methyl ester carboxylesterase
LVVSPVPDRRIRTPDAVIDYTVHGDGPVPIILVHGWGCRRTDWDGVAAHLPDTYTALAIDLPAHGGSTAHRDRYTMSAYADDVAAVVRAEGLSDVVVVGHSMGGAVVLTAAARHSFATKVIGIDSFHYLQVYPKQEPASAEAFLRGFHTDFAAAVDATIEMSSVPDTPGWVKEAVRANQNTMPQAEGLSALTESLLWDMDATLDQVDVPVAVLAAEPLLDNEAVHRYGHRMRFTTVPGASHYFLIEQPAETAAAIAALASAG